ncbi:MAG: NAD(P)/FAD-dependent oxidoreductase [Chloroflexota bacterium]
MTQSADIVIVGAGVQGSALAFHLAGRGADVLVVERAHVGSGATGRSSGFVRMHYDLESEARLAWASLPYFTDWDELVGAGDCSFVNCGFLQLVPADISDRLRANVAMMQGIGIDTRTVGPDDVAELVPGAVTEDIVVAAYEPRSGYADPAGTAAGLLEAARGRGARSLQGRQVRAVLTRGDRVIGVETDEGRINAEIVVNASGAWAATLAATVGLQIPVDIWRHDTMFLGLPDGRDPVFPIVLDHSRQVYFRPEGREQMLVGLETSNEMGGSPDRPYASVSAAATEELIERLCERVPWMAEGTMRSAYGGQDGMTPDQRPIIEQAGPEGHYLLCGFSGSGFKTAPAVGLGMAEMILDGVATSVDLSPYSLERFATGKLLVGEHAYPNLWQ